MLSVLLLASGVSLVAKYGAAGPDTIYGTSGADEIRGYGGDDVLRGGPGDDTIYGGSGNDIIYGGAGNDTIYGGGGVDRVYAGDGVDAVETRMDGRRDYVSCGAGSDGWVNNMLDLNDPQDDYRSDCEKIAEWRRPPMGGLRGEVEAPGGAAGAGRRWTAAKARRTYSSLRND